MSPAQKKYFLLLAIFLVVVLGFFAWISSKKLDRILPAQNPTPSSTVKIVTSTPDAQTSSTMGLKTYRNTDFGFEFQYPENWSFQVDSSYSPFSKFTLEGDSSAENYNPFNPAFVINIVTPDFADRQFSNLQRTTSQTSVGGVVGTKYEYEYEGVSDITIIISLGQYKMLLGADKDHESAFGQILASFKFLK